MPNLEESAEQFISQMLRGVSGVYPKEYSKESKRHEFIAKHCGKITPFATFIPRYNAAIGAVVIKCAIKYGLHIAIQFARSTRDGTFNGPNDPAHKLWLYLARNKNFKSRDIYRIAVSAARAYCEGKTLKELRFANKDIFDWTPLFEEQLERVEEAGVAQKKK